jgi:hypothetical protein
MTIKELESKATAAELCLIREVASALRQEIAEEIISKAINFLRSNHPPNPSRFADPVAGTREYVERLVAAVKSETED